MAYNPKQDDVDVRLWK